MVQGYMDGRDQNGEGGKLLINERMILCKKYLVKFTTICGKSK